MSGLRAEVPIARAFLFACQDPWYLWFVWTLLHGQEQINGSAPLDSGRAALVCFDFLLGGRYRQKNTKNHIQISMHPLLAFVHIEKTAGITLNRILRASFGRQHCDAGPIQGISHFNEKEVRELEAIYPNLRSIAGHQIRPVSDLAQSRDIRYFTMVRDPLARCASHYQHQLQKMGKTIPFNEWMETEKYWNFQCRKLSDSGTAEEAIEKLRDFLFVGQTERFDESMTLLKQLVDWSELDVRYKRKNVASDNSIKREVLSHYQHELLVMNNEDLKLHDFVTSELYPAYQSNYTGNLAAEADQLKHLKPPVFQPKFFTNILVRNGRYKPWMRRMAAKEEASTD